MKHNLRHPTNAMVGLLTFMLSFCAMGELNQAHMYSIDTHLWL